MSRPTRIFLAGVLAILPLVLTAAIVGWAVGFLNQYVGPQSWFGAQLAALGLSIGATSFAPYLLGLVLLATAIFLLGLLLESRLGDLLGSIFDRLVGRIPVVSSVYELSKRFTSAVDPKGGGDLKSMSPVWCFFGGAPGAAVLALMPQASPVRIGDEEYVGILVPSAPVPVGGALIYVPRAWLKPAEGGVDELMSVYVSMGMTLPGGVKAG